MVATACKPVPTAPDPNEPDEGGSDRTYTNEDWGFSIAPPPDSLWSLSATQFRQLREPNGLNPVQVVMRRLNLGFTSRPAFLLDSFGSSGEQTLDQIADTFESQFSDNFNNYNVQGDRIAGTIGGVPSLEWRFFAREPESGLHLGNNLYLAFVWSKGDQIYVALCSGRTEGFPEADFRNILSTFAFQ